MTRGEQFAAFVDSYGDRAPEIVWLSAISMLELAASEGRQARWTLFELEAKQRIATLRAGVGRALELADFAVVLQVEEVERHLEIKRDFADALQAEIRRTGTKNGRKRR